MTTLIWFFSGTIASNLFFLSILHMILITIKSAVFFFFERRLSFISLAICVKVQYSFTRPSITAINHIHTDHIICLTVFLSYDFYLLLIHFFFRFPQTTTTNNKTINTFVLPLRQFRYVQIVQIHHIMLVHHFTKSTVVFVFIRLHLLPSQISYRIFYKKLPDCGRHSFWFLLVF